MAMAQSHYGNMYAEQAGERSIWRQLVTTNLSLLAFLFLGIGTLLTVYLAFNPEPGDAAAVAQLVGEGSGLSAPLHKFAAARPVTQRVAGSPGPIKVGVIAGHTGYDSGAVCADGLTEAQVNLRVAQGVAERLRAAGIHTDVLQEFDQRLAGYDGTALVSIHADSCDYFDEQTTGFKIAGSSLTDSSDLSICIEDAYRRATGLPYHANTITPHMTNYHAFREIAPGTPAIIIELGFLNLDRGMLTTESDRPVVGVADGILCFVQDKQ